MILINNFVIFLPVYAMPQTARIVRNVITGVREFVHI